MEYVIIYTENTVIDSNGVIKCSKLPKVNDYELVIETS